MALSLDCSLWYSIDDALKFITTLGLGTHFTKVNLMSAYWVVPIHPEDRHLLGICWDNNVYGDLAPGLTCSPVPWQLQQRCLLITQQRTVIGSFLLMLVIPPSLCARCGIAIRGLPG